MGGMFDIMGIAENAINAYSIGLEVTSTNIANLDVSGYKRLNISFQSLFERLLQSGSSASLSNDMGGTNPLQLGQSAAIGSLSLEFTAGERASASNLSATIDGQGMFIVSNDGGKTYRYTRAGSFTIDSQGNLLTSTGWQVYGFYGSNTSLTPISGLTAYATVSNLLSFTEEGKLVQYSDTNYTTITADTGYQLALVYFNNPSGLEQTQGTTFKESLASGAPSSATTPSSSSAVGKIVPRYTENSNVFYLQESIIATELQRAAGASLSMLRMANDILNNFLSKI